MAPLRRLWSAAFFLVAALLYTSPVRADDPSLNLPPIRARVFSIALESYRTTYKVGEPIYIRVQITNLSNERLEISTTMPWGVCALIVLDKYLMPVPRTGWGRGIRGGEVALPRLEPHETKSAAYGAEYLNGPAPPRERIEWTDIKDFWGYDLKEPGTYTLIALPKFYGYAVTPEGLRPFDVPLTAASTPIKITIVNDPTATPSPTPT